VPVFGAVFPEVIHGVEHSPTGLVVVGLDNHAEVTVVRGLDQPGTDFAAALASAPTTQDSVLVLVDGLSLRIARFVEAVFDHIGGGPSFIGGGGPSFIGGGGGSLSFQPRPCLFTPQGLLAGAALVVSLDTTLAVGVRHGWQAIAGPFVVTRTDGNTVQQLDYRPAAEVYQACVGPVWARGCRTRWTPPTSSVTPRAIPSASNALTAHCWCATPSCCRIRPWYAWARCRSRPRYTSCAVTPTVSSPPPSRAPRPRWQRWAAHPAAVS